MLTSCLLCRGRSSQAQARAAQARAAAATTAALPTAVAAATAGPSTVATAAKLPTPDRDATATLPVSSTVGPKRQPEDAAVTSTVVGAMTSVRDGRSHGRHLSASVQQAAQLQPTAAPSHAAWPVMNPVQSGMTSLAHLSVIPGKRLSCVAGSGCEGCSGWKRVVCDHASLHYMSPAIA